MKAGRRVEWPGVLPRKQTLLRWLRFNLVGGIGIAVQLVLLVLLKSGLHLGYRTATVLAVEAAVIHNYLWHERYTWADRPDTSARFSLPRLVRFNVSNGGVSLLGNLAVMEVAIRLAHIPYIVANVVGICFCSLLNFLVSDIYVFRTENPATYRRASATQGLATNDFGTLDRARIRADSSMQEK